MPTNTALALKKDNENQAIGRSKGGLSTKIHLTVDALGNPLACYCSGRARRARLHHCGSLDHLVVATRSGAFTSPDFSPTDAGRSIERAQRPREPLAVHVLDVPDAAALDAPTDLYHLLWQPKRGARLQTDSVRLSPMRASVP